ncbi:MAG: DNA polymerase III subunit beta, partial [Sedimentisphaerales bacterium]|nr:DNA polymerase III subunit beta [Sedimentisphaerales bacterium]
ITADKDSVRIGATDLEIGITYRIAQVQVEQAGEAVVPADRLAAIVRESVDEVVSFEATESACHLKGADSHFTIYSNDPSQFPAIPDFDGTPSLEIELSKLQIGVEQTLFATARESTRYAINGVLWELHGKKLTLVATDGRRLARCKVDVVGTPDTELAGKRIIVPAKTMALLDKVGGSEKDKAAVKFIDNQVVIACANVVISSNLVEGNFPKYEDIIPTDYTNKIILKTEATLSAVRRAALLTNEDSKGIKLAISKNVVVFSSRAPETGDAQIDMSIEYSNEPIEIGFNPAFLVDVLRVIKTKEFELELGQPDRPGLFKSGPNFLYVVMPINLG